MAKASTPWGATNVVEELNVPQRAGEKRFATIVQLLADKKGEELVRFAYSTDGMWINLFRVQSDGRLAREKLVDMSRHNYVTGKGGVEPNVHITPDKKWVVFTGQFEPGQRHVYAVEIAKR